MVPMDSVSAFGRRYKRGAQVIKLFVTGGHGTGAAPKDRIEMTRDELAAAIDAAHQRGRASSAAIW